MNAENAGDVVFVGYPSALCDAVRSIAESRGAAFHRLTELSETLPLQDRKIDLVLVDIRVNHPILVAIERHFIESDQGQTISGIFLGTQEYELGMRSALSSSMADYIQVPGTDAALTPDVIEKIRQRICHVWDSPEYKDIARKKTAIADRFSDLEFIGKYKHLIGSSGLPVIGVDPAGVIWEANFAAHVLLEYGSEELYGKRIEDQIVFDLSPEERERMDFDINHSSGWRGEVAFRMKSGELLPCLIDIARIWNERSQCIGKVYCLVDLRREKKIQKEKQEMEERLHNARRMEAVGQLAGGVAHDFNNLLTGILGFLTLVMDDIGEGSPNHKRLKQVEQAAQRAAELTRQLLAFGRRSLGSPEPLNLRQCVNETLNLFRSSAGARIEISLDAPDDLWLIKADPALMSQVLMNLFVNARDAIPQEGQIAISLANVRMSKTGIPRESDAAPGDFVLLEVRDTGRGMDQATRERIFEPFFSTKGKEGSGLGLPMVHGIVHQYKGWTAVESEPGQGSCLRVYLPRTEESKVTASTAQSPIREKGQECILIVDDEEIVLELASTILERQGYKTLKAANGFEAIELFNKERGIDLVLLDLTMPKMSGEKTLVELLRIRPDIRVILSSGYSLEGVGRDFRKEGAAAFIQKPYRVEELARCVRDVLDGVERAVTFGKD